MFGVHAASYGLASTPELVIAGSALFMIKWAIFGGMMGAVPYDPWELAVIAWMVDMVTSVILLAFLTQIERLQVVGPMITQARTKAGETLLQYPGLRRMTLSGVGLFVFLPLPGSGAVTGTLIARILGVSRSHTFTAVATGALLAVSCYAFCAHYLPQVAPDSPLVLGLSLAVLLLFGWFGYRYAKRELSRS
jgi:uncharacterized membrane protein